MSLDAMRAAFALQGISPTDALVLLSLANFADEEWSCFPSKDTLEKMTKLSGRAVTMAIRRLEEAGYVARQQRFRENGSATSNRYTLHLGEGGEFASSPASAAPPPRRQMHQGGESPAPPERSLNHQKEVREISARDGFAAFWKAYPLKKAKDAALTAYHKALRRIDRPDAAIVIQEGVARYVEEIERTGAYVKHPATWLNGGCWEDEPSQERRLENGHEQQPRARRWGAHQQRISNMAQGALAFVDAGRRREGGG